MLKYFATIIVEIFIEKLPQIASRIGKKIQEWNKTRKRKSKSKDAVKGVKEADKLEDKIKNMDRLP